MKITIDESNRTIQVHDTVPLEQLLDYIEKYPYLDDYSLVGTNEVYPYNPFSHRESPIPGTFTTATSTT